MGTSMSVNRAILCSVVMTIQGARRLYECLTLGKPSQSKMWFVHWVLGLVYYLAMPMAVWIEGIRTYIHIPPAGLARFSIFN